MMAFRWMQMREGVAAEAAAAAFVRESSSSSRRSSAIRSFSYRYSSYYPPGP
jgi:hypothetical protein